MRTSAEIKVSEIKDLKGAISVIELLLAKVSELEAEVIGLRTENSKLQEKVAKLSKDSSTSSKPPSSDITKPREQQRQRGERKAGGQRGHKGVTFELLPPEKIDEIQELELDICPDCGKKLVNKRDPRVLRQQVIELVEKPVEVTEYQRYGHLCLACAVIHYPALPEDVIDGQLFGPRLQALLGYMKGNLGASYTELRQYCEDVLGIHTARGTICDVVSRVSAALRIAHEEIAEKLRRQETLNIDETSWRDSGKMHWVWVFCNQLMAYFTIAPSRGSQVLRQVLGETFPGAIISDFYSAYVAYASAKQQFCLAHLIRDIKYLATLPDKATQEFAQVVLRQFQLLFRLWHRRIEYEPDYFIRRANRLQRKLYSYLHTKVVPRNGTAMKKRLVKHWDSLFRFVLEPNLYQPTNNVAEQTLRALIRIRRQTQGSRSAWGQEWTARVMTVLETCRKQKTSSWQFISQAVSAFYFGHTYPSLLPDAP